MENDLTKPEDGAGKTSDEEGAAISEIFDPHVVQHIYTSFSPASILTVVDDSLPYHQLGGPGLERLCYSLISARGGVPRYFGNPGQKQYAIDLIVIDGNDCNVYQCKNVTSFTWQNMGKALNLFEKQWLGHEQLPRPTKFILCCPLPLRERTINEEWTIIEREFFDRTGVRIEAWDQEYLDSQLKKHPDIVSDLFSDQAAERFCDLTDWNEDLFHPVRPGSGERTVKRYLGKKAAGQIYIDARLLEDFTQKFERHGSLLILGLPGSGKTTTGLALAESFRRGLYRIFYINMRRDLSEDTLVRGIRRRLARPTIFLIDDCHGKYDEILEGVHDRLQGLLAQQPGRAMLMYVARTAPAPVGMSGADHWDFVEWFKKEEATLELSPTLELFASITALTKPNLQALSEERLNRIFSGTGRDLFLLDQFLDTIKTPDEIDRFEPEHLFKETLIRYFGQPTVHRPGFMRLTALAQYEIAPLVSDFPYDLRGEDAKAAAQLTVVAGHPPRYFFLHSSAAELVFRALARNYSDDPDVAAARHLIEFFSGRTATDPQLPTDLSSILHNRLKLRGEQGEENLLKSRFLGDDCIHALVEASFDRLSLNTVALLLNTLKSTKASTFERYRDLVQRKIEDGTVLKTMVDGFPHQFIQLIKIEYPSWYIPLRAQFADQGLHQIVKTREIRSFLNYLAIFADQPDSILDGALDSTYDDDFNGLIERSVSSGRSIGNIHWALRNLSNTDLSLLEKVEKKIGARRFLRLIVNAGTVFELFKVIEYSSLAMVAELIGALDDVMLNTLVNKTIESRRSIGTLSLTLRELKKSHPHLLEGLERKIGAPRYIYLTANVGTIVELFGVIRSSSHSMALELINALDDVVLDTLISKTIESRRSIATLDFTLRELRQADSELLEKLEQKIGAERYLHLIANTGTVFELFKVIQHSSRPMRLALIEALDEKTVNDLIAQTITSGRSIGTLPFTLRELKLSDLSMLEKLERKIGVERWWNLILANGKVSVLARLITHMDDSFRREMVRASQQLTIADWERLFMRGNFGDLAAFIRNSKNYFPTLFTGAFVKRLSLICEKLVHAASWLALNSSTYHLSESPDSPLKDHLQAILYKRLAKTDIASLRFETFEEAAACINVLWRWAVLKRDELVQSFFNILPKEDNWHGDTGFMRAACGPLFVLACSRSSQNDDRRMLDLCNQRTVATLVAHARSPDIFFFLWNLYSLWFKCEKVMKKEASAAFVAFLDPEIRVSVNRTLNERLRSRTNQLEKVNLVSLCGFLYASGIADFSKVDKVEWLSCLPGFEELLAKTEAMKSFLTSSFFLLGLGLIFDKEKDIPKYAFSWVLSKASSYEDRTDAFGNLHKLLSTRIR